MTLVLCLAPSVASATSDNREWLAADTPNFHFLSQVSWKQTRQLAIQLESFRQAMVQIIPGIEARSSQPTFVYLFKHRKAFEPFTVGDDGKPRNWTGFFRSASDANFIALNAEESEDAYRTIFHEYLHFLARNNFRSTPTWINEGSAEYYSTFRVHKGRAETGHPINRHLKRMITESPMRMGRFLKVDNDSPEYTHGDGTTSLFYSQSWLLAHYMFSEPQLRTGLKDFFALLQEGKESWAALRDVYDLDLHTLEKNLYAYARRSVLLNYEIRFDNKYSVEVKLREFTPAEISCRVADLILHAGSHRYSEAKARLEKAIARAPESSTCHTTRGILHEFSDEPKEAAREFARAIALGYDGIRPHLRYARLLRNDSDLEKAEEVLRAALKRNPASAEAMDSLTSTLLATSSSRDEERLQEAIRLGIAACESSSWREPRFLHTLAWAYHRIGADPQALNLMDEAIRLDPRSDALKRDKERIQKSLLPDG
jgi:tetratricopeptide (TPR) repeat protein